MVAASFLTVGFQTAANFLAGSMRMPLPRYLPALFVGGAAWALIYATAGLGMLEVLGRLFAEQTALGVSAVAALVLAVCGMVVYRRRRAAPSPATPWPTRRKPVLRLVPGVQQQTDCPAGRVTPWTLPRGRSRSAPVPRGRVRGRRGDVWFRGATGGSGR